MRVPTCAYDARWGAYATISPSFGLEIVAPSRHNESYRPRCRAVRRGAECENGIRFAGMEMPVCSSQRTKYRSQMVLPRRPVIPASNLPFLRSVHPSCSPQAHLPTPSRPHLRQPLPRGACPGPSGANLSAQREGEGSFSSPSVSPGGARAGAPPHVSRTQLSWNPRGLLAAALYSFLVCERSAPRSWKKG